MKPGPRASLRGGPGRGSERSSRTTVARVAFIALLAGAIGIAFAPIFVRLSELGPSATAFYRLALPILWLWMEIGDRRSETNRPAGYRDLVGLALSGLFFAGDLGLWHWSIKLTSVANSTLLVSSRFSTAAVMAYGGLVTCAALLLAALVSGEDLIASTAYGWAVLLGVALVSQVRGQSLIAYALAHLPSAFSSVSLLLQPVAAAMLAWVILGEALGAWQGLGGAVVLLGIVLARRGSGVPA